LRATTSRASSASGATISQEVVAPAPARAAIIASRPVPEPMSSTRESGVMTFASARSKAALRCSSLSISKCQRGMIVQMARLRPACARWFSWSM
jgi:hypothetical protein